MLYLYNPEDDELGSSIIRIDSTRHPSLRSGLYAYFTGPPKTHRLEPGPRAREVSRMVGGSIEGGPSTHASRIRVILDFVDRFTKILHAEMCTIIFFGDLLDEKEDIG